MLKIQQEIFLYTKDEKTRIINVIIKHNVFDVTDMCYIWLAGQVGNLSYLEISKTHACSYDLSLNTNEAYVQSNLDR